MGGLGKPVALDSTGVVFHFTAVGAPGPFNMLVIPGILHLHPAFHSVMGAWVGVREGTGTQGAGRVAGASTPGPQEMDPWMSTGVLQSLQPVCFGSGKTPAILN